VKSTDNQRLEKKLNKNFPKMIFVLKKILSLQPI